MLEGGATGPTAVAGEAFAGAKAGAARGVVFRGIGATLNSGTVVAGRVGCVVGAKIRSPVGSNRGSDRLSQPARNASDATTVVSDVWQRGADRSWPSNLSMCKRTMRNGNLGVIFHHNVPISQRYDRHSRYFRTSTRGDCCLHLKPMKKEPPADRKFALQGRGLGAGFLGRAC